MQAESWVRVKMMQRASGMARFSRVLHSCARSVTGHDFSRADKRLISLIPAGFTREASALELFQQPVKPSVGTDTRQGNREKRKTNCVFHVIDPPSPKML